MMSSKDTPQIAPDPQTSPLPPPADSPTNTPASDGKPEIVPAAPEPSNPGPEGTTPQEKKDTSAVGSTTEDVSSAHAEKKSGSSPAAQSVERISEPSSDSDSASAAPSSIAERVKSVSRDVESTVKSGLARIKEAVGGQSGLEERAEQAGRAAQDGAQAVKDTVVEPIKAKL